MKQFKKAYTTVLLSNLTLERTIWPSAYELTGIGLDAITRTKIWENQWDFGHGTGHGVGYFLSVHEGPHSISKKGNVVFQEGMIVTNGFNLIIYDFYFVNFNKSHLIFFFSYKHPILFIKKIYFLYYIAFKYKYFFLSL